MFDPSTLLDPSPNMAIYTVQVIIAFIGLAALMFVAFCLYFLPTLVARKRHHHNATAITVVNVLGGWMFLIWLGALVWAFTSQPVDRRA